MRITGTGFEGKFWGGLRPGVGYGVSLIGELNHDGEIRTGSEPFGCELIAASEEYDFRIDRQGRMVGYFVVPTSGGCFQQTGDEPDGLPPGRYDLIIGCHTCTVAHLTIAAG